MLAKMAKVALLGPRSEIESFLDALYDFGFVHLVDASANVESDSTQGDLFTSFEADRTLLSKIEAVRDRQRLVDEVMALSGIRYDPQASLPPFTGNLDDLFSALNQDRDRILALARERGELSERFALVERYRSLIEGFKPFFQDVEGLTRVKITGVIMEEGLKDKVLASLRERLDELTEGAYRILWRKISEGSLGLLILYPPQYGPAVATLLGNENIEEIALPSIVGHLPFGEGLKQVEKYLADLPDEIATLTAELNRFRDKYRDSLPGVRETLLQRIEELSAVRLFAGSRYFFMTKGFLEEERVPALRARMKERFGDIVEVKVLPIPTEERASVPVLMKNPAFLRPFERLLAFLPTPAYGTVDPTPMMALTFPLFFGIMLGDIGYGLVLCAVAPFLPRILKGRPWSGDVAFLLAVSGASAILFGFVFGEFFGTYGHELGLRPLWRDRMEAGKEFLIFSLTIGAAHVLLSFLISAFQSFRNRLPGAALGHLASILVLCLFFLMIASLAKVFPQKTSGLLLALLAGGIVLLIYLGGLFAALELISALGNILSYARLMALGLAGAAMAMTANRLAGAVGSVAAGAVIVVLMHGINIVLGIFSPTVHGLRLHYVEFLQRFYHYGGRAYRPFPKGGLRQ